MKNLIKYVLQKILGYQTYLFVFSKHKIRTLKKDRKEKDFFMFLSEIKGDGVLLDVGANIGIMTYHMSKEFPKRKIYAIEPMPTNFSILKRIKEKFQLNNVELVPSAVGNKSETIEMILPYNGKVKMQGLAHVVHDSIDEWNEGDKISVECTTLDALIQEEVAGIKMDIENFEFFALEGARRILKNKPVVYLELWANENRDKCFELLAEFNYEAFVVSASKLEAYNPEIHQKQNFIFK